MSYLKHSAKESATPEIIAFTCEACGNAFKVKSQLAGRKATCKCSARIVVPTPQVDLRPAQDASDGNNLNPSGPQPLPEETEIFWSMKSIPELALLSPVKRRRAWRACVGKPFRHWRTCWISFLIAALVFTAGWIANRALFVSLMPDTVSNASNVHEYLRLSEDLSSKERYEMGMLNAVSGVGYLLSVGAGLFAFLTLHIAQMRPHLKSYVESTFPRNPEKPADGESTPTSMNVDSTNSGNAIRDSCGNHLRSDAGGKAVSLGTSGKESSPLAYGDPAKNTDSFLRIRLLRYALGAGVLIGVIVIGRLFFTASRTEQQAKSNGIPKQFEQEPGPRGKALERMRVQFHKPDAQWISCSDKTIDDDLRYLAEFTKLTDLKIKRAGITDVGLKHLGQLTTLEDLDLSGTSITDAGLSHLAALTQLDELNLSGTKVHGEGLRHLRSIRTLKQLYLRDMQITDAGLDELRQALPKLVVYPDEVRVPLMERQAMYELQKLGAWVHASYDHIFSVNLSDSGINDEQLKFVTHFPKLSSLDISGTRITDEGLSHLQNLRNLYSLELRRTRLEGSGFKHLKGLMKLKELQLEDVVLADGGAGLDQLRATLPQLEVKPSEWCLPSRERSARLALTKISVSVSVGRENINGKEQWRVDSVDLDRTTLRTNELFQHLLAFDRLESLNLYGSNITDEGISQVAEITSLKRINLARTKVTDEGVKKLAILSQLRDLNLSETQITDNCLASLEGLLNLEHLNLDKTNVTDDCIPQLLRIPNLNYLSTDGTQMTPEGIEFWRNNKDKR